MANDTPPKKLIETLTGTRNVLAYLIVVIGALGITAISWVAIKGTTGAERTEVTRMVFTAVLPLVGTWVGAVLAYYFQKENFLVAAETTKSALETVKQQVSAVDGGTQVTGVMTPVNRIAPRQDVATDADARKLTLASLYQQMKSSGFSRVPIFASKAVLYVVHEPDIDKYAQDKKTDSASLGAADTLAALLQTPEGSKAVATWVAVSATATVADARTALSKASDAKDVFVTSTGAKNGEVIGWLTNSELARVS